MNKPIDIFKCLSDQSRLNIVHMLMKKPMYVEIISSSLGLANSTVSFHLKKLEKAGIVTSKKEQYYTVYALNKKILNLPLSKLMVIDKTESESMDNLEEEYRQKVLKVFFDGDELIQIPVQRKKKNIILEKLAEDFEIGKEYTEKEVNEKIKTHHEDFCTLRREFIMTRMFERNNGIYVRKG